MRVALDVWWLLSGCFAGYVAYNFLLCATHTDSKPYTALWLGMCGLYSFLLTRLGLSGMLPMYIPLLFLFACGAMKIRLHDLSAPLCSLFMASVITEGFSSPLGAWLSSEFEHGLKSFFVPVVFAFFADLCFLILLIFIRKKYFDTFMHGVSHLLYIITLPQSAILFEAEIALRRYMGYYNTNIRLAALFIFGISMVLFFLMLEVFRRVINRAKNDVSDAVLKSRIASQRIYISEARKRSAQYSSIERDTVKQLLALRGMLDDKQYAEAEEYTGRLLVRRTTITPPLLTGSLALDVLLKEKLSHAMRSGIQVCCKVCIPVGLKADDMELCFIFSSIMDNAVAACMKVSRHKRFIYLSTRVKGDFLIIEAVNSVTKNRPIIPGAGLKGIGSIASRHRGKLEAECSEGTFRLRIKLHSPNPSER